MTTDRHHLLSLFEKLHVKYDIQEGEYKEFVEALGGKNQSVNLKDAKIIKVDYDLVETEVDFCDDEILPKIHVREGCSKLWMVIPDVNDYHGRRALSNTYMYEHEMHLSAAERLALDYQGGKFTSLTLDSETNKKFCLRVMGLKVIQ